MKKILLPMLYILLAHFCIAQETFEIKNVGTNYSVIQINEAFANADLCGFYFSAERRKIIFDDGTVIELKKQSELPQVSGACFTNYNPNLENDTWKITISNHLVRIIPIKPTK